MRRRAITAFGSPSPGSQPHGRPAALGVASLVATALTWLLQAAAGRIIGPDAYATFMVAWGFVFLEIGILLGLQQEVTRAVASDVPSDDPAPRVDPLVLAGGIGLVGGVLCLVTSPLWGHRLFGDHWLAVVAAMAAGFPLYAVYNAVNGVLAGRRRWTDYSWSIVADALLRLAAVVPVMLLMLGLGAQAWALDASALAWVVLLGRYGVRKAVAVRIPGTATGLTSSALHAMLATGCSALLIAGFPVLLQLTSHRPLGPEAGVVIAAVIATRAPLLLPLNAFQAVILTRLVLGRDHVLRTLSTLLVLVIGGTAIGVVSAYAIGPTLLRVLYGSEFRVGRGLVALLVLGAGLVAAQTVTGSAMLATGRHRLFATAWVAATVVAVLLLSLPLPTPTRTVLALVVAPLVGLGVNLVTLARSAPVRSAAPLA